MSHLKPSVPSKSHYKITYRRSPVKYCDCILEWLCALVSMRNIRCCLQQEGEVPSASGGGSDFHNQCGKFPRKWKAQAVQMYSTCEKWSACHHMVSGSFAPSQHFCTDKSVDKCCKCLSKTLTMEEQVKLVSFNFPWTEDQIISSCYWSASQSACLLQIPHL